MEENINGDVSLAEDLEINKDSAVDSIDIASETDNDPSTVYQNRDVIKAVNNQNKEVKVTPKVAAYAKQSPVNMAAISGPDLDKMSDMERLWEETKVTPRKTALNMQKGRDLSNYAILKNLPEAKNIYSFLNENRSLDDIKESYINNRLELESIPTYLRSEGDTGKQVATGVIGFATQLGSIAYNYSNPIAETTIASGIAGSVLPGLGTISMAAGGFGVAVHAASSIDTARQTLSDVYEAGVIDIDPNSPNKLSEKEVTAIGLGAGVVMGALELAVTKAVAKVTPIGKMIKSKEVISKIASNPAIKAAFAKIGMASAESGLAEGVQEIAGNISKHLAQGKSINDMTIDQLVQGSGTALLTGAASIGTLGTLNIRGNIKDAQNQIDGKNAPATPQSTARVDLAPEVSFKIDELDAHVETIKKAVELEKSTSIDGKQVLNQVKNEILPDQPSFIREEDINKFIEKNDKARETFEKVTGKKLDGTLEMHAISASETTELVKQIDGFEDAVRAQPDGPSRIGAKQWLENIKNSSETINNLLKTFDLAKTEEERQSIVSEIGKVTESTAEGVFDVSTAEQVEIIPESVKSALPEGELEKYQVEIKDVKGRVAEAVMKATESKVNKIVSLDVQVEMDKQEQAIEQQLNNDPKLDTVEKFTSGQQVPPPELVGQLQILMSDKDPASLTASHQKEGYSFYAIDPRTLPENLRDLVKDKRMKDNKIFVKGGLHYEDTAKLLGYKNGERLLVDLKNTPSKEELKQQRLDLALKQQVEQSEAEYGVTKQDYLDSFSDMAKVQLKEIDMVLKEKTGTAKQLIKRLAMNLKTVDDLKVKAENISKNLKLSELNPTIYRTNSYRSLKNAAKFLTSGDFFGYFSAKENQALNTLLEGQSQKLIRKVNRNQKAVARIMRPENMRKIENAGPMYSKIVNDIITNISFNPKKSKIDLENFKNFVQANKDSFDANFIIPDKFLTDTKVHASEMTTEQYLGLTDLAIDVANQAYAKDSLKNKHAEIVTARSFATIESKMSELKDRADYNQKEVDEFKSIENSPKNIFYEKYLGARSVLRLYVNGVQNYTNQVSKLDIFGSTFYKKLLVDPLNRAMAEKQKDLNVVTDVIKLAVKEYGFKDYINLHKKKFNIPEFEKVFKNGVTKADLISIACNLGTEKGIQRTVDTLGKDLNVITKILEQHLEPRDFKLIQSRITIFEKYIWPKNLQFHEDNKLNLPRAEEGVTTTIGQHVIKGYYPLNYKYDESKVNQRKLRDVIDIIKDRKISEYLFSSETQTYNGHNESRAENVDNTLAFNFHDFESTVDEVLHDIHMRIPLRDISRILSSDSNLEGIVGTIGVEGYASMVNGLKQLSDNDSNNDSSINSKVNKLYKQFSANFSTYALGLNFGTVIKQYLSLPVMFRKLQLEGSDGFKYYINALTNPQLNNPKNFMSLINYISSVDPEFKLKIDQLYQDTGFSFQHLKFMSDNLASYVDDRGLDNSVTEVLNSIKSMSMKPLTIVSLHLNTMQWIAAYNQAKDGKANGYGSTDSDATAYASYIVKTSLESNSKLDEAEIFRVNLLAPVTHFLKQPLVIFQNVLGAMDTGRREFLNSDESKMKFLATSKAAMSLFYYSVLPAIALNLYKGSGSDEENKDENWLLSNSKMALGSLFDNAPIFRDIKYAATSNKSKPRYPSPLIDVADTSIRMAKTPTTKDAVRLISIFAGIPKFLVDAVIAPQSKQSIESKAIVDGYIDYEKSVEQQNSFTQMSEGSSNAPTVEDKSEFGKVSNYIKSQEFETLEPEEKKQILDMKESLKPKSVRDNPEGDVITLQGGRTVKLEGDEREGIKLYMLAISNFETANGTQMNNPNSSAKGHFHFIDSTWTSIKNSYPDLGLPDSVKDATIGQQYAASYKYLGEGLKTIKDLGLDFNLQNLYLFHMLGQGNFKNLMQSDKDENLDSVLPKDVIDKNDGILGHNKTQTVKNTKRILAPFFEGAIDETIAEDEMMASQ